MKISELMLLLSDIRERSGDIEVAVALFDESGNDAYEIKRVDTNLAITADRAEVEIVRVWC